MCIRWGSNPRLRRDWGLNPTPSWLVIDERPTRPRIQMCRKDFVRDSDRVRTRIDLVRIDPATLAGVDFKSTALTTRPHYRSPIREQDRCGSRTRDLQIFQSVRCRVDGVQAQAGSRMDVSALCDSNMQLTAKTYATSSGAASGRKTLAAG